MTHFISKQTEKHNLLDLATTTKIVLVMVTLTIDSLNEAAGDTMFHQSITCLSKLSPGQQ